jgi:hypothetical protein
MDVIGWLLARSGSALLLAPNTPILDDSWGLGYVAALPWRGWRIPTWKVAKMLSRAIGMPTLYTFTGVFVQNVLHKCELDVDLTGHSDLVKASLGLPARNL